MYSMSKHVDYEENNNATTSPPLPETQEEQTQIDKIWTTKQKKFEHQPSR